MTGTCVAVLDRLHCNVTPVVLLLSLPGSSGWMMAVMELLLVRSGTPLEVNTLTADTLMW